MMHLTLPSPVAESGNICYKGAISNVEVEKFWRIGPEKEAREE